MVAQKVSAYAAQPATGLALADLLLSIDVSDATMSASGTDKNITEASHIEGLRRLLTNQSVTAQSPFASQAYLVGSNVAIPSGYPVVGTKYKLKFDVTKTAAGTATPIVIVHIGAAGTTADAAICTFTFAAGTAAADAGIFEVEAIFRTVGSGTSAVLQGFCRLTSNLTTTGLSNAVKARVATSSGFNSTTAGLIIGASYNGGASAAHTIQLVNAELIL